MSRDVLWARYRQQRRSATWALAWLVVTAAAMQWFTVPGPLVGPGWVVLGWLVVRMASRFGYADGLLDGWALRSPLEVVDGVPAPTAAPGPPPDFEDGP